ncbi:hypothetical protein G6F68_017011 [Rhizopus microsporus]|nr:hypothetical protein G6F68_017011 [Rhizopus microsporus]
MQERTVSYAGTPYALPAPFFVLATQNPIEQAGTYPLPEAQLDRFLLHVLVDYPSEDEERQILEQTTGGATDAVPKVMDAEAVIALQAAVRQPLGSVRRKRNRAPGALSMATPIVAWDGRKGFQPRG